MRMKPKTARRLLLAAVVVVLGVSAAVGLLGVRQWQRARGAERLRTEGMALFSKGEYFDALAKLGAYLRPGPVDREALLAYAKCREMIEEPDGHHLIDAVAWYKRCYEMDPTDLQAGRTLVRLYNQIGYYLEAADYARRLRPENLKEVGVEHLDLLRAEAVALAGLRSPDARLEGLLKRSIELDSGDFSTNLLYITLLREAGRSTEAQAFAGQLAREHPDDGRARVLAVLARGTEGTGGSEALFGALCEAAGLDPVSAAPVAPGRRSDPVFAGRAVGMFDALGKFPHSLSLLRELAGPNGTDDFRRIFVRRAWGSGRAEEVAALVSARHSAGGSVPAELFAFAALSLRDLGRSGEIAAIRRVLEQRPGDFRAQAWTRALGALDGANRLETSRTLRTAMKECPGEPVLGYLYGETLAMMGRHEEARAAWKLAGASPLSVGWAGPWLRLSESYLAEGRAEESVKAAQTAFRIAPTGLAPTVALLDAQGALIESGASMADQPAELLDRAERAVAQLDTMADRAVAQALAQFLIPRRILLTAQVRTRDEARSLVVKAIQPQSGLGRAALERLASLCIRQSLGLELECLDAADKLGGPSPSTAVARALVLAGAGKPADGRAGLRKLVESAPTARRTSWQVALAQFLDASSDPGALAAWIAVADANPDDLSVQQAALAAPASAGDLAFVERLAQREGRLSGSDQGAPTFMARLARARALLRVPPNPRSRDEAVSILNALRAESPGRPEPGSLLVEAYLLEDREKGVVPDLNAAIETLRMSTDWRMDKNAAALQIAELLQRQHEFDRARTELERVARDRASPSGLRVRAVEMLEGQRESALALPLMEEIVKTAGDGAGADLLLRLASLYLAQRRDSDALAVYRRLAARPPQDPEQVVRIADGLAALNDPAGAAAVLIVLDRLPVAPAWRQLLLAGFAERHRTTEEALGAYESAVSLDPSDPRAWAGLVRFHLSRSEIPKAREALGRALARLPDDPGLKVLAVLLKIAEGGGGEQAALARAMAQDAGSSPRAQVLRAVEQLLAAGTLDDPQAVVELAARFPDEPALHVLVVRLMLQMKPSRAAAAADLARRALASFPTSPEVARVAVEAFKKEGLWREMSGAAESWRQLARVAEADLGLAEATIELGDSRAALALLRPYVERVKADPTDRLTVSVLSLQTKALLNAGRRQEAFDLLAPLADRLPTAQTRVLLSAAATLVNPEAEARRWIERVVPALEGGSPDDRLALASAWILAAQRFAGSKAELAGRAIALLRPLAEPADAKVPAIMGLAWALRLSGDTSGSTTAVLRAVEVDPASSDPLVFLAQALADGTADPAPCIDTLTRLDKAASSANRELRRTLALAYEAMAGLHAKKGDVAGARKGWGEAAEIYRALQLNEPGDQGACLGLARVSDHLGDQATVAAMYERVLARADLLSVQDAAYTRNNLAYALVRPGAARDVLDRARSLVLAAIETVQNPSFYDTLGTVEAARGDREAAIAAFRKAAALAPTMHGAKVELAALLARGTRAERSEAAALVREIESLGEGSQAHSRRLADIKASLVEGPQ